MNKFLKSLEITFRRDVRPSLPFLFAKERLTGRVQPTNFRPRINKLNSLLDKEQKAAGKYFFTDSD